MVTSGKKDADDVQRFTVLYTEHHSHIRDFARRRVGSDLAQEIVAETFLVAWRRIDDAPDAPKAWLYRIALYEIANLRRRQASALRLHNALCERRTSAETESEPHELADLAHAVAVAFETLNTRDQEILRLAAWEQLPAAEGAAVLQCSVSAYRMRLHRARSRLAAKSGARGHVEPRGRQVPETPPAISRVVAPSGERRSCCEQVCRRRIFGVRRTRPDSESAESRAPRTAPEPGGHRDGRVRRPHCGRAAHGPEQPVFPAGVATKRGTLRARPLALRRPRTRALRCDRRRDDPALGLPFGGRALLASSRRARTYGSHLSLDSLDPNGPLDPNGARWAHLRRGSAAQGDDNDSAAVTVTVTVTGPAPEAGGGGHAKPIPKRFLWLRETAVVVVVALTVGVLLHLFAVQTYFIPTPSMEPTLPVGDRIVVDKLAYDLHGVHRGDIVVFARPAKENCAGSPVPDLVKRIIGLPGETISLSGKGYVLINGKRLDETWLPSAKQGSTYPGPAGTIYSLDRPYKIPANHYFALGDNRGISCDSRYWGPIPKSSIVGKVDLSIWPLSDLHFF